MESSGPSETIRYIEAVNCTKENFKTINKN